MTRPLGLTRAGVALFALIVIAATPVRAGGSSERNGRSGGERSASGTSPAGEAPTDEIPENAETAVFAGGCFWCMEEAYEEVTGVYEVVSGYAGGAEPDPDYNAVAGQRTDHLEVVRVFYDPEVRTYEELLYVFWRNVDPLDAGGQFCDRGGSYTTAIFYRSEQQRRLAQESKEELERSNRFSQPIVTEIRPLDVIEGDDNDGFWRAEEYHQEYYEKNPVRYRFYKEGCGRVRRLEQLWGEEAGAPSLDKEA
ncbi:MAG: peptide-methionine (S)-S-oxide reductase MsrA [Spirochaetota bacterium]